MSISDEWQDETEALDDDDDDLSAFRDDDLSDEIPDDVFTNHATPMNGPSMLCVAASSLAGHPVPPRQWIVPKFIPARTVTLLGGDGGSGKTLLGLQLGVAMCAGRSWLGQMPSQGGCIFLSAEDEMDELHRRLADICQATDTDMAGLASLHVVPVAGRDATLATFDRSHRRIIATPLFKQIEALVAELQPKLLVLDTLADIFGGDENNRGQTRAFVGMLRGLAIEQDVAVLVNSHPSLSGLSSGSGTSGSTGWSNSVRSRLYLDYPRGGDKGPLDPDERVLTVMKVNYGQRGNQIRMRWCCGAFEPMSELPPAERAEAAKTAEEGVERVFLELLHASVAQGRPVGHRPASNYAPRRFEDEPVAKAAGIKTRALEAAMNRLLTTDRIHVLTSGPPTKRRTILVPGRAPQAGSETLPTPLPTEF